jgi:uncharacterized protein (TIGR03067 family)
MRPNLPFAFALILAFGPIARSEEAKVESIDGVWRPSAAEVGGKPFPDEVRKAIKLELKGDQYTVTVADKIDRGTCKVNSSSKPKTLDITGTEGPNKGRTFLAIYELNGDTLRVCYDLSGKARPTEFISKPDPSSFLATYKRESRTGGAGRNARDR